MRVCFGGIYQVSNECRLQLAVSELCLFIHVQQTSERKWIWSLSASLHTIHSSKVQHKPIATIILICTMLNNMDFYTFLLPFAKINQLFAEVQTDNITLFHCTYQYLSKLSSWIIRRLAAVITVTQEFRYVPTSLQANLHRGALALYASRLIKRHICSI